MSYGLEQKVTWLWTQMCPHTCTGGKPGCFSRWSSQIYCFLLFLILKSRSDTSQGENRWGTGNRWGGNDTPLGLLYSLSYAVEILIDMFNNEHCQNCPVAEVLQWTGFNHWVSVQQTKPVGVMVAEVSWGISTGTHELWNDSSVLMRSNWLQENNGNFHYLPSENLSEQIYLHTCPRNLSWFCFVVVFGLVYFFFFLFAQLEFVNIYFNYLNYSILCKKLMNNCNILEWKLVCPISHFLRVVCSKYSECAQMVRESRKKKKKKGYDGWTSVRMQSTLQKLSWSAVHF